MGQIVTAVRDNWAGVSNAPWAFVIVVTMIGLVIWLVVKTMFAKQLADADARIKLRDDEIADYKRKLNGASPQEAEDRMLALQTKVEELSAKLPKIGPRRLTSEQSQQLTAALKGHPHMIKIVRDVSIPDAWDYAQDFKRAFEAAGWSVLEGDVMGLGRHPNFGIGLQISTKDSFTAPAGKLLEQAFQAAGLKHEVLNTFENFMPKGTPMMRTPIGSIIIARDTITTA